MRPFPRWMRLGGWLAGGLNWHFFLMWPLVRNGLLDTRPGGYWEPQGYPWFGGP